MNISSLTSRMRYGLVVLAVAIAIITVFLFFHFNQSELNEDSPHGNDMSMDKTGHGNQEQIIEGNLELATAINRRHVRSGKTTGSRSCYSYRRPGGSG